MSLQTLKDLSRLRKKRKLWPLLYTASMLADHSSLLSSTTPRYLQVWTISIIPPSMQADWYGVLDLPKPTTSSLVLVVFRSKQFFLVLLLSTAHTCTEKSISILMNFKRTCLCHFKKKEKSYVLSDGSWKASIWQNGVFFSKKTFGCWRPTGYAIFSLAVIFSVDLGCFGHNKGNKNLSNMSQR